MHFVFSASLLAAFILQCSQVAGMAVDPRLRFQDGLAKQDVQFSEDTDATFESHRNYRQASIDPTDPQVQKEASGAPEELKIVIKHHTAPSAEENEDVDRPYIKRSETSAYENEQLLKDLAKKIDSLESNDKQPKTRSYSESVLYHRNNRYDRPSNGNLEVYLGGSSSGSHQQGGYAAQEWQYQGFGNQGPVQAYSRNNQEPLKHRYNKPIYPVPAYQGDEDRHKPRVDYPESHYENKEGAGYRKPGAGSGEYEPKRNPGYQSSGEGYGTLRREGYRTSDNSDEEQRYMARTKSGYRGSQEKSGCRKCGNKYEESGYHSENEENYYGKQENESYSSEENSDEVLVKISVNNDQDSADVGKVKVNVKKDKGLFPDDRQLKISVTKDKDLSPGNERDIKLELRSDHEEDSASCESEEKRTIVQVKKPRQKCCKKRKNKCSRYRKY